MTYTPVIYDWRRELVPIDQVFDVGGQSISGGLTAGGAMIENPEPGGRAVLDMSFPAFWQGTSQNLAANWTAARIKNGSVMRIKLCSAVYLVPAADLSAPVTNGIPWSNDLPWASGESWAWNPTAPVAVAASIGASEVAVDMSGWGDVLQLGHVIGFSVDGYDFAHEVMDISYDASDIATIEVSPPLRRSLTTDDGMKFRPSFMGVCINAAQARPVGGRRRFVQLGQLRFVEALV